MAGNANDSRYELGVITRELLEAENGLRVRYHPVLRDHGEYVLGAVGTAGAELPPDELPKAIEAVRVLVGRELISFSIQIVKGPHTTVLHRWGGPPARAVSAAAIQERAKARYQRQQEAARLLGT